jgi:transcriptional regulator with XRE-family HTH domain
LNQLKVALDLNVSREALSHYENGKRSPDLQMLRELSRYFNVSIDFLINGEEFTKNEADSYESAFVIVALSENKPPLEVVELKVFRYKYSSLWYNRVGPPTKTKITRRNSQND